MKRWMTLLVYAGAIGIAVAGDAPYTGPKPTDQYLFCTASRPQHELPDETVVPAVVYYSAAFVARPEDVNKASDAFLAFVKSKYKFEPEPNAPQPVVCTSVHSLDQAKSLRETRLAQSKQGTPNTVDTGWTFGSPTAAAGSH